MFIHQSILWPEHRYAQLVDPTYYSILDFSGGDGLQFTNFLPVAMAVLGKWTFGIFLCVAKDNSKEILFTILFRLMTK